MKKRLLSFLVIMAMCLSLLPVGAFAAEFSDKEAFYVKGVAYIGTLEAPCYLISDENGDVSSEGANENHYNIKWDGANLILKDAYVVGIEKKISDDDEIFDEDYTPAEIAAIGSHLDMTVTLIGENKLVGTSEKSSGLAVCDDANLTIGGEGSLEVEGEKSGIYAKNGEITINSGRIVARGDAGIDVLKSKNFTINGGTIDTSGESRNGIHCNHFTMTNGTLHATSRDRFGIGAIGTITITGGVVNIEAGTVGILLDGDYDLTIGGNAEVTIQSEDTGIEVWAPEPYSNCNFIFNGGTLDIRCGNEMFAVYGDVYAAPTTGNQIEVKIGDGADDMQALSGSPFMTETAIKDLVGNPKYITMYTETAAGLPYTDVQADDWFYDAVAFASKSGLMTGTSATTFEPNTSFSRAMLVSVLHRLEGSPAMEGSVFSDVNDGDWYAEAVNWAAANGIVNGMDDGSFQPNAAITREQMAAILCNYAQYKGIPTESSGDLSGYSDADQVSAWAEGSVIWAVDMGLIHGMSMNTLEPQGTATRAQAATVLMNAGTLLGA